MKTLALYGLLGNQRIYLTASHFGESEYFQFPYKKINNGNCLGLLLSRSLRCIMAGGGWAAHQHQLIIMSDLPRPPPNPISNP